MSTDYKQIGSFLKTMGTKGEIKADVEEMFMDELSEIAHVFILEHGTYVPYFIENIREANHLLFKLEDVDNPETASSFNLKPIFLKEDQIKSTNYSNQKEKEGVIDYEIKTETETIGVIKKVEIFPHQVMATVLRNGKNIYIPMVDEWITNIDKKSKSVFMELPDGILDI